MPLRFNNLTFLTFLVTPSSVDKRSSDVAEDEGIVILIGLVAAEPWIRAVHRSELVLSDIGDADWQGEEKPLNGNDVNRINCSVAIHIGSRQPASRERSPEIKEMPLDGYYIHRIDASGTRCHSSLSRGHRIAPASHQRRKRIVTRAIGQG